MSELSPADPIFTRQIIAEALMRRRNGRRTQDRAEVAAIAAADHLAEAMRLAGLVVMQAVGEERETPPARD